MLPLLQLRSLTAIPGCLSLTHLANAIANGDMTVYYPNSSPWLNTVDTLVLSWSSKWKHVNCTLYCQVDNATKSWRFERLPRLDPEGSFVLPNVNQFIHAYQFPTVCHFNFQNFDNSSQGANGGRWVMNKSSAPASTARFSTKVGGPTSTATGASETGSLTAEPSQIDGSDAPASTSGTSNHQSHGISKGAKIAIAILVPFGVIAVAVMAFLIIRSKRKSKQQRVVLEGGAVTDGDRRLIEKEHVTPVYEMQNRERPGELDGPLATQKRGTPTQSQEIDSAYPRQEFDGRPTQNTFHELP